jgi:hypothetical protein
MCVGTANWLHSLLAAVIYFSATVVVHLNCLPLLKILIVVCTLFCIRKVYAEGLLYGLFLGRARTKLILIYLL